MGRNDKHCCLCSQHGSTDKSPFELWFNKKPSIKHLRIIGSECFVHVPKQKRKKMNKKAIKGILVGYDNFGYRVWTGGSKMLRSRDVIFNEKPLNPNVTVSFPANKNHDEKEPFKETDRPEIEDEITEAEKENDNSFKMELRIRESILRPQRYDEYVSLVQTESMDVPETYIDAVNSENSENWIKAMMDEITALNENKTWELQELPENKKALLCKRVYKIKENPDGTIERYKARLVVKGFSQQKGIDYNETFSPVARMSTIRGVLSVAAANKMHLSQFDVSTAFLYGELEEKEEIFIKQPEGFNDRTNRVCKLNKSLCGLKQAARCWHKRIVKSLTKFGFNQS